MKKIIYFLALMSVMHFVPAVFSKPVQSPKLPSSQGVSSTVSAGTWGQFKAKAQVLGEKIANSFKLNSTGAIGKHFTSTGSVGKHFTQTSPMGEYFSQKVNKLATKVEKITSKMPTVFTKKKPLSEPVRSRKDSVDTSGDLDNSYGAEPIYAVPQVPSSPKPAPENKSFLNLENAEYENLHTNEWMLKQENSVNTGGKNANADIYQNIDDMNLDTTSADNGLSMKSSNDPAYIPERSLNNPSNITRSSATHEQEPIYINYEAPKKAISSERAQNTGSMYENLQLVQERHAQPIVAGTQLVAAKKKPTVPKKPDDLQQRINFLKKQKEEVSVTRGAIESSISDDLARQTGKEGKELGQLISKNPDVSAIRREYDSIQSRIEFYQKLQAEDKATVVGKRPLTTAVPITLRQGSAASKLKSQLADETGA